ncbi:hypothetical protein BH11PLA2_BH11PLA2_09660 [soil metagenome]
MPDAAALHPAFAEILRMDREALNARFALRLRAGARIDADAFQRHLRTVVNDLIAGVAVTYAERVRPVAHALYDVSLELFACGLLGPTARNTHTLDAWRMVLPQATSLLTRDSVLLLGCLSNAVNHIAGHTAARPAEWISLMSGVSPTCDSVPQWLEAGKILAWRAGLVQYRPAAFQAARKLPWKLAAHCFAMPENTTETEWLQRRDHLEFDRWLRPENAASTEADVRIVRTTGGFSGFGGPCLRPPKVIPGEGGLFVSDGIASWQLLADACGTLWHRVTKVPAPDANTPNVTLDSRGKVVWNGVQHKFDELTDASSYAFDGQTLAVTLPTSHHVFLVACTAK